jgi:hypothetical protein
MHRQSPDQIMTAGMGAPSSLLNRPDSPQTFPWPPGSSGGQHYCVNELFQEKPMT